MQAWFFDTKEAELSHSDSGRLKPATMHASARFSNLIQAGSSFCLDHQSACETGCSPEPERWA